MVAFNASVQEIWDELNTSKVNYENAMEDHNRSLKDSLTMSNCLGAADQIFLGFLPLCILAYYNYKIIR